MVKIVKYHFLLSRKQKNELSLLVLQSLHSIPCFSHVHTHSRYLTCSKYIITKYQNTPKWKIPSYFLINRIRNSCLFYLNLYLTRTWTCFSLSSVLSFIACFLLLSYFCFSRFDLYSLCLPELSLMFFIG